MFLCEGVVSQSPGSRVFVCQAGRRHAGSSPGEVRLRKLRVPLQSGQEQVHPQLLRNLADVQMYATYTHTVVFPSLCCGQTPVGKLPPADARTLSGLQSECFPLKDCKKKKKAETLYPHRTLTRQGFFFVLFWLSRWSFQGFSQFRPHPNTPGESHKPHACNTTCTSHQYSLSGGGVLRTQQLTPCVSPILKDHTGEENIPEECLTFLSNVLNPLTGLVFEGSARK